MMQARAMRGPTGRAGLTTQPHSARRRQFFWRPPLGHLPALRAAAATTTPSTPARPPPVRPSLWHLLWPPSADDALRSGEDDLALASAPRPPPTPAADLPRPLPPPPPPTTATASLRPTLAFLAATALADPGLAWRTAGAAALIMLSKVAGLAAPLELKAAVDALGGAGAGGGGGSPAAVQAALRAIALFSAARLVSALAREAKGPLFTPVAQAAARSVAHGAFAHALTLDPAFHLARHPGALARSLERGTRAVAMVWRAAAFTFAPTAVELALVCALLAARFTPAAAAGTAATFAAYTAYTILLTRAAVGVRARATALDAASRGKAVEALAQVEAVRAAGAAAAEAAAWDGLLVAEQAAALDAERLGAALNAGQAAILTAGLGCVLAAVACTPGVSPGDLVAAQGLLLQAAAPLSFLGWFYRELRTSLVDLGALLALLRRAPALVDGAQVLPPGSGPLGVEIEDVHFAYPPPDGGAVVRAAAAEEARGGGRAGTPPPARAPPPIPVLRGVTLSIPPGRKVAIVGPSGSGKSTLLRLLTRSYDPGAGAVRLGGVDVRDLRAGALAAAVAVVPQDAPLFHDTIAANIAYGMPQASRADVAAAAEAAALGPALARMPAGLDTLVGAGGARLSGGERQRVAVARACLRRPRLLLADEATSALDSATEAGVMAALDAASAGRTAVFVAHRLSSVARVVDEIVVLVAGRVVEAGPHEALLAAGGVYAARWAAQSMGEGGEGGEGE